MDCPITAKHQSALACFSASNQHRILQYLAHLAARQYTALTLNTVVRALPALLRLLPRKRHVVLAEDLTQATAQDISMWLLLDSRGVDLTRAYNSIFASHRLLEVLIFQGPYQGFTHFRRTLEHKTLESNKSQNL